MPSVIKCIVQGKRIEEVLRVLKPYALEPPVVEVIDNSATSPAKSTSNNNHLVRDATIYVAKIVKSGAKTISSKQMQEFCFGLGSTSYSYVLKRLVENKVLKRTKDIKIYEIVR